MIARLEHRLQGPEDAPVIVLPSSLGTTHAIWEPQLPALAQFRILLCDLRGHGGSEAPAGPYSVAELAQDVLDLLDALRLERFAFCGLSLGGAVGLWLAAERPRRVERLLVGCSSARFDPDRRYLQRAEQVRAHGMESVADAVLERWFTRETRARRPALVARYRERLLATPVEGYAGSCEAIAAWDFRERLAAIEAPTLVIAGLEDEATPPEHGEQLAGRISHARLALLERAAHQANAERPRAFDRLLVGHLTGAPMREGLVA
jgi:3-oxoadipate enol-lactonase